MRYTKAMTEKLIQLYTVDKLSLEAIADEMKVPLKSVITKLSSLGLHKKQPYRSKTGELPIRKSDMIELLAVKLNVDVELLESLSKSNKFVLKLLLDRL